MPKLQVNYKTGGGNVVVKFFSGVLISHWIGQLILPNGTKKKFEGVNNDSVPDELVLTPADLPAGAELDWWVVVFAPANADAKKTENYTVTVKVEQGGNQLCPSIVRPGVLEPHKAKVELGEMVFTGVA